VCTQLASFEKDYTGMHSQQNIKKKKNQYTLRTIIAFLLQIFSQYTQQKMFKTHATDDVILLCMLSINPKTFKITNQNAVFMVYRHCDPYKV